MHSIEFGGWTLWVFTPKETTSLTYPPNTYFAQVDPTYVEGMMDECPQEILFSERYIGKSPTVEAAIKKFRKLMRVK